MVVSSVESLFPTKETRCVRLAASDPLRPTRCDRPAATDFINVFNFDNKLNYLLRLVEISDKKQTILKSFLISSQSQTFETDILQNIFLMPLKFI